MALTEEPLTPSLRAKLELLHSSGQALLYLVNNVLDLSRVESGTIVLEKAVVRLRALVQDVVQLFGGSAAAKGLECTFVIDPAVPKRIVIDPHRVSQILNNLVGAPT